MVADRDKDVRELLAGIFDANRRPYGRLYIRDKIAADLKDQYGGRQAQDISHP